MRWCFDPNSLTVVVLAWTRALRRVFLHGVWTLTRGVSQGCLNPLADLCFILSTGPFFLDHHTVPLNQQSSPSCPHRLVHILHWTGPRKTGFKGSLGKRLICIVCKVIWCLSAVRMFYVWVFPSPASHTIMRSARLLQKANSTSRVLVEEWLARAAFREEEVWTASTHSLSARN